MLALAEDSATARARAQGRTQVVWYFLLAMGDMRAEDVVELLGRVPAFETLQRGDLERISEVAVPRAFEPGQLVFREGDDSDTCYIVRQGHARAIRTHADVGDSTVG